MGKGRLTKTAEGAAVRTAMVQRTVMTMMVRPPRRARAVAAMASRRTTGKDLNQAMLGEDSRLTWATAPAETKARATMEGVQGKTNRPKIPVASGRTMGETAEVTRLLMRAAAVTASGAPPTAATVAKAGTGSSARRGSMVADQHIAQEAKGIDMAKKLFGLVLVAAVLATLTAGTALASAKEAAGDDMNLPGQDHFTLVWTILDLV